MFFFPIKKGESMSDISERIDVKANYQNVLQKVEKSASKSGRELSDVTIVGVTKRIGMDRIKPVLDEGLKHLGEVISTELKTKINLIREYSSSTIIHVVGHMQSNKAKFAVEKCNLVESVQTEKILALLNKYSEKRNKLYPIFFQVDFSGRDQRKGMNERELLDLLKIAEKYTSISVQGLMTIAPLEYEQTPSLLRKFFSKTFQFYEKSFVPACDSDNTFLSMGMSNDYEIAIQEGSNLIRVGTAIFGPRNPK